jgi:GTPase
MSESNELAGLQMGQAPAGYRSGFVCIVGRPNVGKSTFMNQLLHQKVAITSDRPQTTRNAIRGILTTPNSQIVFVDTPGLHKPRTALGRRLNKVVRNTLSEVDVIVFMVDATTGVGSGDEYIAKELTATSTPVLAVLNKIDTAKPHTLEAGIKKLGELGGWSPYGISALTGAGIEEFVAVLESMLPEGPLYYPPDEVTDQSERRLIAELIREKVLERTREEVPHSVAVVIDEVQEEPHTLRIFATVHVERDSQKGIVIGKGGSMLKEVGTAARRDIEALLGTHVFLDMKVKVSKDWQQSDTSVVKFGYGE